MSKKIIKIKQRERTAEIHRRAWGCVFDEHTSLFAIAESISRNQLQMEMKMKMRETQQWRRDDKG